MALLDKAADALQGIYHQANVFDGGRTFDTNSAGKLPGYRQATQPNTSTPSYQPSSTKIDTSMYDKAIADARSTTDALRAQLAAQPKLPFYNTSDAWARANKTAANVVNPVYVDKMNAYLQKAALKRKQTEAEVGLNKESINTGLTQSIEDIGTSRVRTAEDAAIEAQAVDVNEGNYQLTEGTQFDRARRSLLGEVASANLTTSGIGQQIESEAITDRNNEQKQKTQAFEAERSQIERLKTRTFADLDKSEGRAKTDADQKTRKQDMDLKYFIDGQALEENEVRTNNEAERLAAISRESQNQYKLGVANFIQGLIGSGGRAQDIALAQQVYA